jgi:hypothetical protein
MRMTEIEKTFEHYVDNTDEKMQSLQENLNECFTTVLCVQQEVTALTQEVRTNYSQSSTKLDIIVERLVALCEKVFKLSSSFQRDPLLEANSLNALSSEEKEKDQHNAETKEENPGQEQLPQQDNEGEEGNDDGLDEDEQNEEGNDGGVDEDEEKNEEMEEVDEEQKNAQELLECVQKFAGYEDLTSCSATVYELETQKSIKSGDNTFETTRFNPKKLSENDTIFSRLKSSSSGDFIVIDAEDFSWVQKQRWFGQATIKYRAVMVILPPNST